MSLDLEAIKTFADCAWYYPGEKPDGQRDAKEDILALVTEVTRLTVRLALADDLAERVHQYTNGRAEDEDISVGEMRMLDALDTYRAAKGETT